MKWIRSAAVVRDARAKCKLSKTALGARVGVTGAFISKLERGITPVPANLVRMIARITRTDVERFVNAYAADSADGYAEDARRAS